MTVKKLEAKFNVNIIRPSFSNDKYMAYRGGNSTGEPVIDIASAHSLETLAIRIERFLSK